MPDLPIGVWILGVIFFAVWIFTRGNVANILAGIACISWLVLVIVNSPDTWVQISCEIMIFAIVLISLVRTAARATGRR
jgi:low temperature requirement protein LtrA